MGVFIKDQRVRLSAVPEKMIGIVKIGSLGTVRAAHQMSANRCELDIEFDDGPEGVFHGISGGCVTALESTSDVIHRQCTNISPSHPPHPSVLVPVPKEILPSVPPPSPVAVTLPIDSAERKEYPMYTGLLKYFPAALAGVARHSKKGNDKHNPGEPMHHARGKSTDHADCIIRHLVDLSDMEAAGVADGVLDEVDALCWRALALSQELYERFDGAPLAPGAKE